MNFLFPEQLDELNRKRIERDRIFLLKEEMIKPASELSNLLDRLGTWMIAKGRKLHDKYSVTAQSRSLALLQDESRIFRA